MKILSLGKLYVSDFLEKDQLNKINAKYPLELILDKELGAVKLSSSPPKDKMWGKYWYRSGTNSSMKKELKSIVEEITERIEYKKNDIWLDIACNDGTIFKFISDEFIKIGIDPADNSFFEESSKLADSVVQDYFSKDNYFKSGFSSKKAKIITTIAMFYDLEDPDKFVKDINEILDDDGLWVIQISYTPLMLKQMAFDNICHEHFYYHSLNSLKKIFSKNSLKIVDASLNDTNGGSIRVYIRKEKSDKNKFGSAAFRDVCSMRVESIIDYEKNKYDISNPKLWNEFSEKLEKLKKDVVNFIKNEKNKGKVIAGYGASTKGNTLLQYFGLDNTLIDYIAERSPHKYGLYPDYLLILPWHFISEFKKREEYFLKNGGKFIVPCPKLEII